ncbi:hypothetical protein [Saccharibacillus alkalitolerans]|uniref:ABC transporter permease n=1 Tax=Saccharibacillus alkalitolerans TaxID=2705290 RepID=A0ABX0FEA8_9BACL|nr:hypothetical protein [Saccharibacillus alkalitolerans]NGZ77427.1 hypothetical protein [Saccharibacillus alkalitolerans]
MGGTWRQAWLIVGRELKIDRYYLSGSLVFILYMGFFGGITLGEIAEDKRMLLLVDLIFWIIASMVGFYFSRRITKYITEDSYTHMLAHYRTLPIATEVLVVARYMQLLMATLCNGVLLFGLMYAVSSGIREQMTLGEYAAFALTWTAFGVTLNCFYIMMEFLLRGKGYFWYSLVLMLVLELAILSLHLSGVSVVQSSIEISARLGGASPAMWIMLALGAVSAYVSYRFIVRRLPLRDLA